MKVFSDMHHHALLQSLILLFEKRLGGELYRPIGLDWYPDFWSVYPHIDTAKQYLSTDQSFKPVDGTPPLNTIVDQGDGVYLCHDIAEGIYNKAITLEAFKTMQFDILIASLPQHIEPFKKLIELYQPQAKLIYQIGNQWNVDSFSVKNVMASAKVEIPPNINGVVYHQEFDLNIFHRTPVSQTKKIYSFINCLNTVDIYRKDWELFLDLERILTPVGWEFRSFGGQTRDGAIAPASKLADKMREATLIFQSKNQADGYGHVIHNAMAIGRPILVNYRDYSTKLAGEKLIPNQNCIDVDNKTPQQIADEIIYWSEEPRLTEMGMNMYNKFKELVDFDKEEVEIRKFLDNLQ